MAGAGSAEQAAFMVKRRGLYTRVGGRTGLGMKHGGICLDTLNCVGFASAAEPDWGSMQALSLQQQSHG